MIEDFGSRFRKQIAGRKSTVCAFEQLFEAFRGSVNYSTLCIFAAQIAIEHDMEALRENDTRSPEFLGQGKSLFPLRQAYPHSNLMGMKK